MMGEQLPSHGGVGKAEFDVALDAAQQRGVVVLEKNETFEPIEPPWQAIKQWILADEIVVLAVGSDTGWHAQHSNGSPQKAKRSRARCVLRGYLNDFHFDDAITQRQHDPVFGCLELGLHERALDYLTSDPEKQMASGKLEALRLLALEQAGTSSEYLAHQSVQSSLAYPDNLQILDTACIQLASSEQYHRLFRFFRNHPTRVQVRHHPSILHNLAAAAAQTARFKSGSLTHSNQRSKT